MIAMEVEIHEEGEGEDEMITVEEGETSIQGETIIRGETIGLEAVEEAAMVEVDEAEEAAVVGAAAGDEVQTRESSKVSRNKDEGVPRQKTRSRSRREKESSLLGMLKLLDLRTIPLNKLN